MVVSEVGRMMSSSSSFAAWIHHYAVAFFVGFESIVGHHGTLFGETFHVLSLFREIAFRDEQGEVGILHTGCFEARIECLLDAFPDGIAVRL